jgi:biotin carboxyl carrier protein
MATYKVKTQDKEYEVTVTSDGAGGARVIVEGREFEVQLANQPHLNVTPATVVPVAAPVATPAAAPRPAAPAGAGAVVAPIPGVVLKLLVKVGDQVTAGQNLLVLEAMKMENDITATVAGEVKEVAVAEGAQVSDGQTLVVIG